MCSELISIKLTDELVTNHECCGTAEIYIDSEKRLEQYRSILHYMHFDRLQIPDLLSTTGESEALPNHGNVNY